MVLTCSLLIFAKIAEACGAQGYKCSNPAELHGVLQKALASSKPCVIEIDVDPDARPDPTEKIEV